MNHCQQKQNYKKKIQLCDNEEEIELKLYR